MSRAVRWVGLVLVAACGGEPLSGARPVRAVAPGPDEAPWTTTTRRTQSGRYEVTLALDPPSPPMGQLFALDATVVDGRTGEPVDAGVLMLDARMPQHGHGMMTRPVDDPGVCGDDDPPEGPCPHPDGRYRTEGFKFHMPGEWTITIAMQGPRGPDTTSVVYVQGNTP